MDYQATTRGSIPDGDGVNIELQVLRKGQWMGALSQNDLAVDGTLNTTKQTFAYGISTGIPLNILIIYGKDQNFQEERKAYINVTYLFWFDTHIFYSSIEKGFWRLPNYFCFHITCILQQQKITELLISIQVCMHMLMYVYVCMRVCLYMYMRNCKD